MKKTSNKQFYTNRFIILVILLASSISSKAQHSDNIVGIWQTEEGRSKIKIAKTASNKYFGKIIWVKDSLKEDGTPKVDIENPDVNLRKVKIVGLEILKELVFDNKEKEWSGGTIYDPRTGNTYRCIAWFDKDMTTLFLKGYIGISLLGQKTKWTRLY